MIQKINIKTFTKIYDKINNMGIKEELEKYSITKYTIMPNSSIHAHQSVDLSNRSLTKIPFTFHIVDGNFICSKNKLTSLEGCPTKVTKSFDCSNNQLTSLKGCPTQCNGNFSCANNQLTSLKGCPTKVARSFICYYNKLTSLKGCPTQCNNDFICSNNQLTSLKGCPTKVNRGFYWDNNPINLEELLDLVAKEKNMENLKYLEQFQDRSSKQVIIDQIKEKIFLISLINA